MKHSLLISTVLATLLVGCSSTDDSAGDTTTATNTDPRMMSCDIASVADRGPVKPSLFVTGTFPSNQWSHTKNHEMKHKGNGLYQVVSEEKAGNISFQFATMSWNPQYTAAGKSMVVGEIKELKRGGYIKDTVVSLPVDGKYVWSIQLTADKKPVSAAIVLCK